MNYEKGRYKLISKNYEDNSEEIFDFSRQRAEFVELREKGVPTVSLATIDSLTTVFSNVSELYSYLEKKLCFDREEDRRKCIVRYKSNSTGKDEELTPIFNDEILHEIAVHAKGSKVDFEDETTKEVFSTIMSELATPGSRLGVDLMMIGSKDTTINNHNKGYVRQFAFEGKGDDPYTLGKLKESFTSYREFRALYLTYVRYLKRFKKDNPLTLTRK